MGYLYKGLYVVLVWLYFIVPTVNAITARDLIGASGDPVWNTYGTPDVIWSRLGLGYLRSKGSSNEGIWRLVEPNDNDWQWDTLDADVNMMNEHNAVPVLLITFTPAWATDDLTPTKESVPRVDAWEDLVRHVVDRYSKPPFNVKYFQAWNEQPNKDVPNPFWEGTVEQYRDVILFPAARIIHNEFPGCKLVLGGLANNTSIKGTINEDLVNTILDYQDGDSVYGWQHLDIISIHYRSFWYSPWSGDVGYGPQDLYDDFIATGKCEGYWTTEAIVSPTGSEDSYGITYNRYPRTLDWCLKHNWDSAGKYAEINWPFTIGSSDEYLGEYSYIWLDDVEEQGRYLIPFYIAREGHRVTTLLKVFDGEIALYPGSITCSHSEYYAFEVTKADRDSIIMCIYSNDNDPVSVTLNEIGSSDKVPYRVVMYDAENGREDMSEIIECTWSQDVTKTYIDAPAVDRVTYLDIDFYDRSYELPDKLGFENITEWNMTSRYAGWSYSELSTGTKTQGNYSAKLIYYLAKKATDQDWMDWKWNINPRLDLSESTSWYVDIYPLQDITGDYLKFKVTDLTGGVIYEEGMGNLTADSWHSVGIDLTGKTRDKICELNFYIDLYSAAPEKQQLTFYIDNLHDIKPPRVSITNPQNGETVSGTVDFTADATNCERVEFYIGGDLKKTNTESPYSFSWNTDSGSYPDGTYDLKAKAYAGSVTDEEIITVTVGNSIPLAISNVSAINITDTGAKITWTTNIAATSQVEYGLTTSYGSQTTEDASPVTSHSVDLTGLPVGTLYHYRVISRDGSNNTATSGDNTFTTIGSGEIVIMHPGLYNYLQGSPMTFSVSGIDSGELRIYTLSGKLIETIDKTSGNDEVIWDGLNEDNEPVKTGVYLYSVTDSIGNKKTGKFVLTNK